MKVIILAAGRGKRLGKITENDPKVMAQACDKPLIDHVIDSVSFVDNKDIHIVVGYKKESVMEHLGDKYTYSVQDQQLGTGHAVRCAKEAFKDYDGDVLIVYGDMPLVRKESYLALIEEHKKNNSLCTLMLADVQPIPAWGRIIRDENGYFQKVVEDRDCTPEQKLISEVNMGVYVFNSKKLFSYLDNIKNSNAQNEYYLTDVPYEFLANNERVYTYTNTNTDEILGVNTPEELAQVEEWLSKR